MQNVTECHKCGTKEDIHLLDSKPSSGDENDDFDVLLCVACYGPGWAPCGEEHIEQSIAPHLRPFYDEWRRNQSTPQEDVT